MALRQQIEADLKEALRSGEEARKVALRLLLAAIRNAEIAAGRPADDDSVIALVQREIKQRRDSIEQFGKGNRHDLVEREQAELAVLDTYLPQQLSLEEIRSLAGQAIAEAGATGPAERGRVMGLLMPRVKGRADGRQVSEIVGRLLSG